MTTNAPQVLGISGSLRKGSNNTAILTSLKKAVEGKLELTLFPLNDVPLYNADLDGAEVPPAVRALREAIAAADGLILCSPEYNYGISGVLKNALDWASRPGYNSVLKGKPVLVLTSSPGLFGGARAQSQIRTTLTSTLSRVVVHPHIAIPGVNQKLTDGVLADEGTLKTILSGVDALLAEIEATKR